MWDYPVWIMSYLNFGWNDFNLFDKNPLGLHHDNDGRVGALRQCKEEPRMSGYFGPLAQWLSRKVSGRGTPTPSRNADRM